MKINFLKSLSAILLLTAPIAGCGSSEGSKGTVITDCNLAAHQEVDGTAKEDANREFTLGQIVNSCLKEKGFKPATEKAGCLVEPKSAEQGKAYVKATQECWDK